MTASTLPAWLALGGALLLVCSGLVTLIGSLGLLRLRSFYARMHSPTMGTTLGAGCLLICSMLVSSALFERAVIRELAIALFIVIASPVSAMTLMRAAVSRTRVQSRPPTDPTD